MKIVAAFDFDGTITRDDTFLHFLLFTHGKCRSTMKIAQLSPHFLLYLSGLNGRQKLKEKFLTSFYKGMEKHHLEELGMAFAQGPLQTHIRPQAIERLHWHLEQGHSCVLISASIDTYLSPWASSAGFEHLLCTKAAFGNNDLSTGKIDGRNCWGPEKARRLLELYGPKDTFTLYAYGDSRGDKELLALADQPFYRYF